ncbi:MAG: hypothetical protein ACO3JL_06970 [Myxococcota bacterium]
MAWLHRHITCAVMAALGGLLAGCDLAQGLRTLVVPADSEVTVPGSAGIGVNPLLPDDVLPASFGELLSQQIAEQISTEGVPAEAVDSLTLSLFTLAVEDAVQGGRQVRDLGFLESLRLSLSAGEEVPREVAYSEESAFDGAPTEVTLALTGAELADLLAQDGSMTLTADVAFDGRPDFDTTILFHAEMTVLVNPLGAASAVQGE